jgi:hypothetical protein
MGKPRQGFKISGAMQGDICENYRSKNARHLKTNTLKSLFHVCNLEKRLE